MKTNNPKVTSPCTSSNSSGTETHHTDKLTVHTARQPRYPTQTSNATTATSWIPPWPPPLPAAAPTTDDPADGSKDLSLGDCNGKRGIAGPVQTMDCPPLHRPLDPHPEPPKWPPG